MNVTFDLRGEGLADFVGEDEGGLVLDVQIAAEPQGAMTLGGVGEDGDSGQNVADRELAAGEDGPARHAELVAAGGALEAAVVRQVVDGDAAAAGAHRRAFGVGPADRLELRPSRFVRQAHDLRQGERAGGCGKEEVL